MQSDTLSRLQNNNLSSVKTPSPLGTQANNLTNKLDNIFASVKKQIDEWGENAKWKIDLVLLDKPPSLPPPTPPSIQHQKFNQHPLLSPQTFHPNAITTPLANNTNEEIVISKYSLPISATMDYPWEYTPPAQSPSAMDQDAHYVDDLKQKLNEASERQHYLENIIWSQADQLKHTKENSPQQDRVISTMKSIFLMSQNEQRIQSRVEVDMLQRDVTILSKKLQKMSSLVQSIEGIDLTNQDLDTEALAEDHKVLLRKLHLSELRLSARDTEIDYLNELVKSLKAQQGITDGNAQSFVHKRSRKGPPYLFQQQYSPRSSQVRSEEQHHPLSGLESLGIVADQMLSDPEFESSNAHHISSSEKRLRSRLDDRRSQRSMDSAATLLAMPQLISSKGRSDGGGSGTESRSPEDFHPIPKKPRSTYTRWTQEEDELLIKAVRKYGHSNWEACSRDIRGRSNIQCRNRWIRHLEHKLLDGSKQVPISSPVDDARHSPSIAALLNTATSESNNESSRSATSLNYNASSSSNDPYHSLPMYRPPSPMATPKGKRRSADNISTKW
ncbi:hypothetical protein K501DRAFT_254761 [Backusella circina FSU 941]|nr:hypothetical protein K501DRAFT_254761 [Backusella circina FSU 941]